MFLLRKVDRDDRVVVFFQGLTSITNKLTVETPYETFREMDSSVSFDFANNIEHDIEGRVVLQCNYVNGTNPMKVNTNELGSLKLEI